MLASGASALGYQIAWTQQASLWLGHETAAVLAVVAAFFGGLGLGALLLSPCIGRSARPARWYAGCPAPRRQLQATQTVEGVAHLGRVTHL